MRPKFGSNNIVYVFILFCEEHFSCTSRSNFNKPHSYCIFIVNTVHSFQLHDFCFNVLHQLYFGRFTFRRKSINIHSGLLNAFDCSSFFRFFFNWWFSDNYNANVNLSYVFGWAFMQSNEHRMWNIYLNQSEKRTDFFSNCDKQLP